MKFILFLVMLSLPFTVIGAEKNKEDLSWYQNGDEGWFFYNEEDEIEPEKPKPKPKPKPAPVKQETAKAPEEKVDVPNVQQVYTGPAPLSAKWLKANLPKYLNNAIDNPTPNNVSAYLYLQKLSMDKASKFAKVAHLMASIDPQLDESTRRSQITASTHAVGKRAKAKEDEMLTKLSQKIGLFYFYKEDCIYCRITDLAVEIYQRKYGFDVLSISIDGSPPHKTELMANWVVDSGQAKKLKIIQFPALFMVNPAQGEDGIVSISQGAFGFGSLGERVLAIANMKGWITDKEYALTQPMNDVPYLTDKDLSPETMNTDPYGFVDVEAILQGVGGMK